MEGEMGKPFRAYFHPADYAVFSLTLLVSVVVGIYHACSGGRQKTATEYLLGNHNMGILPVTLSLLASFNSAIAMLGIPSEVYNYGIHYAFLLAGIPLALPLVSYWYLPVFYRLQVTSVYEYLERRFNRRLRLCGSLLYILQMTTYLSFVVYGPALALTQVTGLHLWGSIASIAVVGTIYTVIGGIKAVMWTDVFQVVIMLGSMIIILVKGIVDLGGFTAVINANVESDRLSSISASLDPRMRYNYFWTTLSSVIFWLSIYGINQTQVQRYLSSPRMKKAQLTVWLNLPGLLLIEAITTFSGLVLYAAYRNCDPLTSGQIQQSDQILPLFVMSTLNSIPGIPGLFVSGVFCGSLSTVSSALNSLAAVTLEDYVRWFKRWRNINEGQAATASKIIALVYGIICIAFILIIENLGGILEAFNYNTTVFSGVALGLFTVAMFMPKASSMDAFIGFITGFSLGLWFSIGSQSSGYSPPRPPVSFDGCLNTTTISFYSQANVTHEYTFTEGYSTVPSEIGTEVSEVYKVSYLLITVVTFGGAVIAAFLSSFVFGRDTPVESNLVSPIVVILMKRYYGAARDETTRNGHDKIRGVTGKLLADENGSNAHADSLL